jgi:hypothetical protein
LQLHFAWAGYKEQFLCQPGRIHHAINALCVAAFPGAQIWSRFVKKIDEIIAAFLRCSLATLHKFLIVKTFRFEARRGLGQAQSLAGQDYVQFAAIVPEVPELQGVCQFIRRGLPAALSR